MGVGKGVDDEFMIRIWHGVRWTDSISARNGALFMGWHGLIVRGGVSLGRWWHTALCGCQTKLRYGSLR
jgi:hypothetical protein